MMRHHDYADKFLLPVNDKSIDNQTRKNGSTSQTQRGFFFFGRFREKFRHFKIRSLKPPPPPGADNGAQHATYTAQHELEGLGAMTEDDKKQPVARPPAAWSVGVCAPPPGFFIRGTPPRPSGPISLSTTAHKPKTTGVALLEVHRKRGSKDPSSNLYCP